MPVIEHARKARPEGYVSDNHRKWEFNNSLYQKHLELYLDHMYKLLAFTGAQNVLDAGCGEGIVYRAMQERGYKGKWTGFDFSDEAIKFAKIASPDADWHVGSAYEIPFKDEQFDVVFCSQVLEHLPNPEKPLFELDRVAEHWLLISVPYEPVFRTLTWFSIKLGLGQDPGHCNHWKPAQFRTFLRKVGKLHAWERTTIYQIGLVDVRPKHHATPV